jgi:hypothetical protein
MPHKPQLYSDTINGIFLNKAVKGRFSRQKIMFVEKEPHTRPGFKLRFTFRMY